MNPEAVSRSFYQAFRTIEQDTIGKRIYELGDGQWDIPELRKLLETIISKNTNFGDYPVEQEFSLIGRRRMILNARRLDHERGSSRILLAMEDVTEKPPAGWLFPLEGAKE